eukprot:s4912_g5.t2
MSLNGLHGLAFSKLLFRHHVAETSRSAGFPSGQSATSLPKWQGLSMGNIAGLRLAGCGPTSMCTGVGNCGDWKNRQTSSDGLVLGPWGKGSSPSYEYPACGSSSTPRNPFEGPQLESPASSASPARDLVRKFVRDMLQGVAAVLPPAWPGDVSQS